MKKLLIIIFLFTGLVLNAQTTYYIDPTGTDGAGVDGSIGTPWLTLSYACTRVTTSGDKIYVNRGTYTETVQSVLAVGVSIEGIGKHSIIISNIATDQYTSTIYVKSIPQGTAGNQTISFIRMDGNALTASVGIEVNNRSNVKIFNCQFVDFKYSGVIFTNGSVLPTTFATGNEIYNCNINNCSGYYTYGRGAIRFGGQDGLKIYSDTLTQNTRGYQLDGFLIKYSQGGYSKGVKIYNNIIDKAPYDGTWCFAIELTKNLGGTEIYNNTISGGIDGDFDTKGSYDYCLYVHDNTIYKPVRSNVREVGIILENHVSDVIIESNHFYNLSEAISISCGNHADDLINNIYIQNNILDEIGIATTAYQSRGIYFISGGTLGDIYDIYIYNNVFAAYTGNNGGRVGILFPNDRTLTSIHVKNNIFQNWDRAYIDGNGTYGGATDYLYLQNNLLYQNGQTNDPYWESGYTVTNLTSSNNIKDNPDFTGANDYTLKATSPAIGAGIGVGLNTDMVGNLYGYPTSSHRPSMGALEYDSGPENPDPPDLPIAYTGSASSVGAIYVLLTGASSGTSITDNGFCFSTSENPSLSDLHVHTAVSGGNWSHYLTGLSGGTTYHWRSFATNSEGTTFGADKTFTTKAFGYGMSEGKVIMVNGQIGVIK